MKRIALLSLIIFRLLTHDGVFSNVRRQPPKKQFAEVGVAIRRPWKKGKKRFTLK